MSIPFAAGDFNVGVADGSDTAITLTASTGRVHVIYGIRWSYSAAPTGGGLTIVDDAGTPNTLFQIDIIAAGQDSIFFPEGKQISGGVITLAGGGGVIQGKLHIDHRLE